MTGSIVERDNALRFANQAFRNIEMPPLDEHDLRDIALALTAFRAADKGLITEAIEALDECADKFWVLHFSLKDEAERAVAVECCNLAGRVSSSLKEGVGR